MLDRIKQLFSRTQDPPYQSGTNLLLVLVLSVVVGAGVSYGTLGFMKAFDTILHAFLTAILAILDANLIELLAIQDRLVLVNFLLTRLPSLLLTA